MRYTSKRLTTEQEKRQQFQLRSEVYDKKFQYVKSHSGMEIDAYDTPRTVYTGVYSENVLVGCHRIIKSNDTMMFEQEYFGVFSKFPVRREKTIGELSRWTLKDVDFMRDLLKKDHTQSISMNLFRETYRALKVMGITHTYTQSYPILIKALQKKGFPMTVLQQETMDNADVVSLALIDWIEFEKVNQSCLTTWFLEVPELR